jgi:hypothetical protein
MSFRSIRHCPEENRFIKYYSSSRTPNIKFIKFHTTDKHEKFINLSVRIKQIQVELIQPPFVTHQIQVAQILLSCIGNVRLNRRVKCNLSSGLASCTRERVIHDLMFCCFHFITTTLEVTVLLLLLLLLLWLLTSHINIKELLLLLLCSNNSNKTCAVMFVTVD